MPEAFILDRMVPEELSQAQGAAAWFLWSNATAPAPPLPFPYHAATARLASAQCNPAWLDSLKAQGRAGTLQIADVAGAEDAVVFLQALHAANPSDPSVTQAALRLWRTLPNLAGADWEIASRGQLQSFQKVDKNAAADLATKVSLPPRPHLQSGRPAAASSGGPAASSSAAARGGCKHRARRDRLL